MTSRTGPALWLAFALAALVLVTCDTGDGGGVGQPPRSSPEPAADVRAMLDLASRGASGSEQRDELQRYLTGHGVSRETIAAVLRHTRDGIALRPGPRSARSRLGGQPVLPAGEPWPTAETGHPFSFVVAFDFADVPHLDPLPREGTLALYWNFHWNEVPQDSPGRMDYVAATRAYFFPPGARVAHPDPPGESYPMDLEPLRGVAMPIPGEPNRVAEEIGDSPDRRALFDAMNELAGAGLYPHHLLGAPIEIQGPVLDGMSTLFDPEREFLTERSRARFTAAERNSDDWVLLAQINEDAGLVIADGGVLHFVILRSDLEAQRFDRVIGVMESH